MGWLIAGLIIMAAAVVNAGGVAPPGMFLLGLVLAAFGAYRLYKKHFAKF